MDSTQAREKLDAFFASGKEHVLRKRSVILDYGDGTDRAYWITSGRVSVVTCNSDGIERILHIYKEQELFPVKWIFDSDQFDVAFFAQTDVTLRSKPLSEFKTLIDTEPDTMLAVVHQQLVVFGGLINASLESAEARIAFRLVMAARRFGTPGAGGSITCPLTMKELASIVRVSRETTGKVLHKFASQGMVELKRNAIVVFPEKLQTVFE